jgi:hypothetical protein
VTHYTHLVLVLQNARTRPFGFVPLLGTGWSVESYSYYHAIGRHPQLKA